MPFQRRQVIVDGIRTHYRLYRPRSKVSLPVILFLHGAGESGLDDLAPTTVGIGPAIRRHPDRFPAIVVFPQASHGYGWRGFNLLAATAALDDVENSCSTDHNRVYVTGLSMGGYGTWLLSILQPARFAAIVPICGGFDASAAGVPVNVAARRIANIPEWVFHGQEDDIIPVDRSRWMVRALRAAGAVVRYTEYPNVRHNSWDRAYAEPELMPWMLSRRLTKPA